MHLLDCSIDRIITLFFCVLLDIVYVSFLNCFVFLPLCLSSSFFRLFSLARPSDQEHLLIDPEMNPESVSSFFSVIIGKKSLMQRWEVQKERERERQYNITVCPHLVIHLCNI